MRNLEARIRKRQRPDRRESVSQLDFDPVLQSHMRRYDALKLSAEDAHDRKEALAYGTVQKDSPQFVQALEQRKRARAQGKDFHDDTFPEQSWYRNTVLPALQRIAPTPEDAVRHSENILDALETVARIPMRGERGRWRSHPIEQTVSNYFEFLHMEDSRLLKALMLANIHRIDLHGDGGSRPYNSYDIAARIDQIKKSQYAKWMPEIFEIFGNIPNGHVAPKFMNNILPILDSFTHGHIMKDNDTDRAITVGGLRDDDDDDEVTPTTPPESKAHLIPTYLRLAHAIGHPQEHGFNFSSTSVFTHITALEKAGAHFDAAVDIVEKGFLRDANSADRYTSTSNIASEIAQLDASHLRDDVPRILARTAALNKEGLLGERYLQRMAEATESKRPVRPSISRYYLMHEDKIVSYARELAPYSLEAANAYLAHRSADFITQIAMPWELPSRERQRYHETGLRLVREFGDLVKSYFPHAATVLKLDPERFDTWRDRIVRFGHAIGPKGSARTVERFMEIAHALLRHGSLDATLSAVLALNDGIDEEDERRRAQGERFERYDIPMEKFLGMVEDIIGTDVSIGRFANDFLGFYKGDMHLHMDFLSGRVKEGLNYDALIDLFPTILAGRLAGDINCLDEIVNASMAISRKQTIIKEYVLAAPHFGWNKKPNLDLAGAWRDGLREKLIHQISQRRPNIDLTQFDLMTLLLIGSIRSRGRGDGDDRKLDYILNQEIANAPMEKAFPMGKSYGFVPVGGVNVRQNPVELTLNLLTALTSSNAERREAASAHFDEGKLRGAKAYASERVIFAAVKEYLPKIKEGDYAAARQALKALEIKFPRSEEITDLVTSVDGQFTQDITFDALEARMQRGVFRDLFDNRDTLCCAFYPSGANASSSINYLLDEHVGLLHLLPHSGGETLDPIGVAIMIQSRNPRTGEKYLLVDSVEAGVGVDRIRDSVWIPLMHQAVMSVAKDTGMDFVIYNRGGAQMNAKPKRVLSYVARTANPETREVPLLKLQAENGRIARFDDGSSLIQARQSRVSHRGDYGYDYDEDQRLERAENAYQENIHIYAEAWGSAVRDPSDLLGRDASEIPNESLEARIRRRSKELPVPGGMTSGYVLPVAKGPARE